MTAILDATIRVLADDGMAFTTTRVAEVAGVSVGTLYQYFPNRAALLNGVLADHLEIAIRAVEDAAASAAGLPPRDAAERVVRAFLAAKAERAAVSFARMDEIGSPHGRRVSDALRALVRRKRASAGLVRRRSSMLRR